MHAAETNLSQLIEAALSGEEVIIARVAFRIGVLEGTLGQAPDFFAPMADDELALWEGEGDERSA